MRSYESKLLAAAGFVNLTFAVFQISLAFAGPQISRYLGAPRWALATLEKGGPTLLLMIGMAAGLSITAGLYCLSGAGLIRRLPALGAVLLVFGGGYTLWGLRIAELVMLSIQYPGRVPLRFFLIRGVPLVLGLIYLSGAWALRSPGRVARLDAPSFSGEAAGD